MQTVIARRTVVTPKPKTIKRAKNGMSNEDLLRKYGGAVLEDWQVDFGLECVHSHVKRD
jgi:hypothetical protein